MKTIANATINGKSIIASPYGAYGVCVFINPTNGAKFCRIIY